MRNSKSYKYKNYGPIPQNEYTTANPLKSADTAAVLKVDPQAGETVYRRRLKNRQAMQPAGRRKVLGWARSWKSNGWRAESAALHDEFTDIGRHSSYVRKSDRSSF